MEIDKIARFVGMRKRIMNMLRGDNPFANYVRSMASFLNAPEEVVAMSAPAIKYYLRYYSNDCDVLLAM